MAQTPEGALKIAAKKAGMDLPAYLQRLAAGERRCTCCKLWKPRSAFGNDRTRYDGCDRRCFDCRRVKVRKSTMGRVSAFKGRHHTAAAKALLSAASRGNKRRIGKRHTPEARAKMSAKLRVTARRGPAHHTYIDGRGVERRGLRSTKELKRWRYDVYVRDGFACRHCGDDRGGNLNAHHIRPFATHPELRFVVSNGITLCEACHFIVHEYGLELFAPVQ